MRIEYDEDREQGNHDIVIDDDGIGDPDTAGRYDGSEETKLDIDAALDRL